MDPIIEFKHHATLSYQSIHDRQSNYNNNKFVGKKNIHRYDALLTVL